MNTSTRSKVICALAVGLLLLCLNTLIMAINTKFASQTGSNDTQFSVGIDIVPFALISVKKLFSFICVCSKRVLRRDRRIQVFDFG